MTTVTTKFDIGDKVFRVFNNSIQTLEINNIYVNLLGDLVMTGERVLDRIEIVYDCKYRDLHDKINEDRLNEEEMNNTFLSAEEAVDYLKNNFLVKT